jgi:hypothetical protein
MIQVSGGRDRGGFRVLSATPSYSILNLANISSKLNKMHLALQEKQLVAVFLPVIKFELSSKN